MVTTADAAEMQSDFRKYLRAVQDSGEIVILEDGKEVARLVSRDKTVSFLTDALTGILKGEHDEKAVQAERVAAHESSDRYERGT